MIQSELYRKLDRYRKRDKELAVNKTQNIPSKNKEIRMLFKAKEIYELVEPQDNQYKVSKFSEVYTDSGWKYASDCRVGDIIITDDDIQKTLKSCTQKDNFYIFEVI